MMRQWMLGVMGMGVAITLASCGGTTPSVSSRSANPVVSPAASSTASPTAASQPTQPAPVSSTTPIESQSPAASKPSKGVVKNLVSGDLKCYVTLVDANNVSQELGAIFEVCENKAVLNQSVNLTYRTVSVSDCRSNEPCGKTRQESLISAMEIAGASPAAPDSQTFSNGEWTIVVGNLNSWSGVNNTGDLTYRGCDSKGKCIDLKGGKTSCRNGVCTMGWRNGDYTYALESPMDNPDRPSRAGTQLTVRQGDKVILKQTLNSK